MLFYIVEFIGMVIFVLFGNGVVVNVLFVKIKGKGVDLIVIVMGWVMVVFVVVYVIVLFSGVYLNLIVMISFVFVGKFVWLKVGGYVFVQMFGGMVGVLFVWFVYCQYFVKEVDVDLKFVVFCMVLVICSVMYNVLIEVICMFVLIFGVLYFVLLQVGFGVFDVLFVGLLVFGIGILFGGLIGYVMSFVCDLLLCIMYVLLLIFGKCDSDWCYVWVLVVGLLLGGVVVVGLYLYLYIMI